MKSAPAKEKVITEGAKIYCERLGNGPLMLLITVPWATLAFIPLQLTSLLTDLQSIPMIGAVTRVARGIQ